ncbi:CD63 antigen-like [Cydia strobilella]|uniref:CD63 antigen-like n=1 Tax=Cydia strobilella TaxID=1100964 RepID=UPI0030055761
MGGKPGRTSKLAAAVLLVVNFIVMMACGAVFAFSLWVIVSPITLSAVIDKIDSPVVRTLLASHTLTASLGVALALLALFIFIVALMGFCGAVTQSQFLLLMYSALILLLVLLECALFYYFSSTLLEKGLQKEDGQWTHALRVAFSCCENVNGTTTVSKLPWSCCGLAGIPDNCTAGNMYQKDCLQTVAVWLRRYQTAAYASLVATHVVLSSCALLRRRS